MIGIANIIGQGGGGESAEDVLMTFTSRVAADSGVVESEQCLIDRITTLKNLGLWDKASAVWLPHGYKEGKLYAVKGGAQADLSFTRNGTRTRKGPEYVEEVPYNLLRYSQDLSNSAWSKVSGTSGVANAAIAPDGTMTATRINGFDTSTGERLLQVVSGIAHSSWYSGFVWLKGEGTNIGKQVTVSISRNSGTPVSDTKNHILTASWVRVDFALQTLTDTDGLKFNFQSAGVSASSFLVWGAQLNPGETSPDYFPTTDRFNVPALDYTNSTCPAWSLEPSRTNLLLWSNDITNAAWNIGHNTTKSANQTNGPGGLTTAGKITISSTSGGDPYLGQGSPTPANQSGTKTFSVWLKTDSGQATTGALNLYLSTSANGNGTISEVSTKSFVLTTSWQRIQVTQAFVSTSGLYINCRIDLAEPFQGGDVGNYIYCADAQLEAGPYATSNIPTTTGTVTRLADSVDALIPKNTNRWLYSEDLTNADWTKLGTTVTSNTITAPDGELTADKITEIAAYTTPRISKAISTVVGKTYTASIYVKAAERSQIRIVAEGSGSLAGYFDVSNGTTLNVGSGATCEIEDVGSGWYRCSMTYVATIASTSIYFATASGGVTVTGDAAKGIYLWGCQFEIGSVASAYLSTTTTFVHDGSVIGQTEGTLYWEGDVVADGTNKGVLQLENSTSSSRLVILFGSSNLIQAIVFNGGTFDVNMTTPFTTGHYRIALSYSATKVKLSVNGVKIGEDLVFTIPANLTKVGFGYISTNPFYGNGDVWAISKTALSDQQAIALTTP